jgi:outer membrane biosynthesis protein TonB
LNYGFGYVGIGYQGGYWNSGHFYYNRSVNNINVSVVHNVYERKVIVNNSIRVSFNGGPGGIQARPRPAELAALREPHAPPMTAQLQIRHAASVNHANFVSVNHGHPAEAVIAKPVMADHDVHPVASPAARNEPARPETAHPEPARPEVRPGNAPPERKAEPSRPATEKPAPRVEPHPQPEARPKPEEHAAPPKPKPEVKPAPKKAPEEKPKPEDEHPR